MNYRHAFHAGNFADVHKHVVLSLIIRRLSDKATPFRVIDSHAGAGCYDLKSPEAERTGEWRRGIARIWGHQFSAPAAGLLAPYLNAVKQFNSDDVLSVYPGSPLLALALMRASDRLIACEAEPTAAASLAARLRDARAKAVHIDGWTAISAYIPPRERRGLVLIDPPYEQPDEFARLGEAIVRAHRKWPTGIYLCWYPIKDRAGADEVRARLAGAGVPKVLCSELSIRSSEPERLAGSGLILVNPPWKLDADLAALMPEVSAAIDGPGCDGARLDWLSGER